MPPKKKQRSTWDSEPATWDADSTDEEAPARDASDPEPSALRGDGGKPEQELEARQHEHGEQLLESWLG
eukprot:2906874-Pyramimonas_sp.AAC.1